MPIKSVKLKNFTAFNELKLNFSDGMNIFIGGNSTGKTHLLKVLYSACESTNSDVDFATKLLNVFLPSRKALGRLVRRHKTSSRCLTEVLSKNGESIRLSFSNHIKNAKSHKIKIEGISKWQDLNIKSIYIPVKEMLSNAPGFSSLYKNREIHFSEVYADIIDKAYLSPLKGPPDKKRKKLLEILEYILSDKVHIQNEEFFLKNIEFSLLAEGIRKIGLLWQLIQNGILTDGSILFWDEPETNLNPKLMKSVVEVLLELQRMGAQIFLATHSYVILKEFDLQTNSDDKVMYHAFYFDDETVKVSSTNNFLQIEPNAIHQTFLDLYDREIEKNLK
ncbi:AAA family ATPase [bacterium]|nr:AAA family ATPase [bacterium]